MQLNNEEIICCFTLYSLIKIFFYCFRIFTTSNIDDVEDFFTERIGMLKDQYGILLLLYTVMCTKGVSGICVEMSDSEPMIDSTYGYGSQSLINLMLTGRAVSNVWDHDQDVGGLSEIVVFLFKLFFCYLQRNFFVFTYLKNIHVYYPFSPILMDIVQFAEFRGVDKQNTIGFLNLLEHLRYCEVGTFLKSPLHPIWVLGSETHLTVLFSTEKRLVSPETPAEQARRVFRRFDPEGNNFIPSNLLKDVLAELGLVADIE